MTCAFPTAPELTIEIKDYATMTITGALEWHKQQCEPACVGQLPAGGTWRDEERFRS